VLNGPRRQLQLLERAPDFRALFLAATASGVGTWLAVVALAVDVYDRTHSAKWVSALLIADFLPAVAIGLAFGPVVDRFARRRLMVGSDVLSLAVFVGLVLADTPGEIVGLAAVAGFAAGFFRPAAYAGLPNIVEEEDLPNANALLRSSANLTLVIGTLVGGVVVSAAGPRVSYGLNAATFAASALLLSSIPARRMESAGERHRGASYLEELKAGFELVLRTRTLLAVFVSWNLVLLGSGGINVAEVELAKVSFNSGSFGYGLLWAGSGAGAVVGSLYAAGWLEQRSVSVVYAASLGLMGFGALATAMSPNVWVGVAGITLGGFGNGAAVVCNSLLVQRGSPDHLRGRAFTALMSVTYGVLGVGMVVAGPVTDAVGARWVFGAAGLFQVAAAVVARGMTRRLRALDERAPRPASAPG
jgi:MFS family permease